MFTKPFSHHDHPREIVRQFTPNWFAVTMGTGILALVLEQFAAFRGLAMGLWEANIALYALCVALYGARWIFYPREASRIFLHPVMPMFLGAIPMGLATIVNGVVVFLHAPELALWLWTVDAAMAMLVGLGVPFAMFTQQPHRLESMTAVWLLPIVACEVAGASAGGLAPHLTGTAAQTVLVAGYVLWAFSVPLAAGILVILFLRLVLHKLPHQDMGGSSWLAVGPLGTGALGLLQLGHAATGILGGTAGAAAEGIGIVGGLILWGYGAWWLLMACAITLAYLPRGLPFNMGWWAFTFPLGVFTAATFVLGAQTGFAFFHILGVVLTVALAGLWALVTVRTVTGGYHGRLFVSPCLECVPRSIS